MRYAIRLQIGPTIFRIGSAWGQPIDALRKLYRSYPAPDSAVADFAVRLDPAGPLRRWWRPSVRIGGDHEMPDAAPMALRHGLLAAEMGMNLQMALGWRRHLLIHASCVERDGRVLMMPGESGSGKSTLAALLGERGWRFMGDEFALVHPRDGAIHPFPRLVSLKNESVGVLEREIDDTARFGPRLSGTPKGDIVHLIPSAAALARMQEAAQPALVLFPRYGFPAATRPVGKGEAFVRLTQGSTNYVALGEAGFGCLHRLVANTPAIALDYPDSAAAIETVERLWADRA